MTGKMSWLPKSSSELPSFTLLRHLSREESLVKQILLLRSYFTYCHSSQVMHFPTGLMFCDTVHTNHLKLLLGCIFGFSVSGMGPPETLHF